ncbi:hypothetical protein P5673_030373 [Acropora cervicornis]|uniref:Uncharacterized protein n=1 Tax=Acropora cervicornis TaxID=6130 RepID=A0AAD9UTD5_ACRCE|nr:hypothetical protein P5673_030373 [Acropora cervicornis]
MAAIPNSIAKFARICVYPTTHPNFSLLSFGEEAEEEESEVVSVNKPFLIPAVQKAMYNSQASLHNPPSVHYVEN